jgi:hypothetical protein
MSSLQQMDTPQNGGDLVQYVAALNWMRSSLPLSAENAAPRQDLLEVMYKESKGRTKKKATSVSLDGRWTTECEKAFRSLQEDILTLMTTAHPDPTIVQTEKLAILVSSYHGHYADYCRGQKNVSQRVPAKVWKKVYSDFMEACRDSLLSVSPEAEFNENQLPAERTLQDALRDALDQDTGVTDAKGPEKCCPQDEDILMRLKRTDGHARRNMLKMRSEMISNVGSSNSKSLTVSDREVLSGPIRGDGAANMGSLGRTESKKSFQKRTADSIESIAQTTNETGTATISLLQEHLAISKEDKVRKAEILKNTKEIHEIDTRSKSLFELAFLRDNGVISKQMFIQRAKRIYGNGEQEE